MCRSLLLQYRRGGDDDRYGGTTRDGGVIRDTTRTWGWYGGATRNELGACESHVPFASASVLPRNELGACKSHVPFASAPVPSRWRCMGGRYGSQHHRNGGKLCPNLRCRKSSWGLLQHRRGGDVWADDMGASIIEMGGSYAQICAAERVVGVCIEFQHLLFLGHFSSLDRSNSETDFMKHGFEI